MSGENQLAELSLFREVSPATVEVLWRAGKVVAYARESVLFRARENVGSVYIQLDGKSMIYNLTHAGMRKIVFILGRGALLNEHVLNSHASALFCETIEKSSVFVISARRFTECMERDFSLTRAVLEAQERKIWRLGHQLKNTRGNIYMERKLAAKLWKLARDFGVPAPEGIEIEINLPMTFLADMLGTPRETTSRLCSTLVEYGLIRMRKKRIILVDPDRMALFYKTGMIEPRQSEKG